jgi:two-component system OmpR family response regulator
VTVLVVDDERKMAELLRRGFGEAGLTADLADSGEAALAMVRESSYEAIVLDVLLPGIDGIEACRRIRAAGVDAPVLLLSAGGAVEDRRAGMDAGADAYLLKPFSLGDLVARVRDLIGNSHPRLRSPH